MKFQISLKYKVGLLVVVALVFGFFLGVSLLSDDYHRGFLYGAGYMKESIETDINNGWVYNPNCGEYLYEPMNSTYIQCNGVWIPGTEARQTEIRNGINLPQTMIVLGREDIERQNVVP